MVRLISIAGSILLVGVVSLVVSAAPAQAQAAGLACTGTQTAHYGPPLGPLPQNTTVQVIERLGERGDGVCTGPFTGGFGTAVFHQQVSCAIPPPAGTLATNTMTYHWDNGERSTIEFPVTAVFRGAGQTLVISTGTVIDGYGEGEPAFRKKVLLDLDLLECLATSVEQRGGPMILTIG